MYNALNASKLQDYVEGLLFRNKPKPKITHADQDHLFLAIAQNWAVRLFVGFVMQVIYRVARKKNGTVDPVNFLGLCF